MCQCVDPTEESMLVLDETLEEAEWCRVSDLAIASADLSKRRRSLSEKVSVEGEPKQQAGSARSGVQYE